VVVTVHLVRGTPPPPEVVRDGDPVLYAGDDDVWTRDGVPLTDAQLLDLVLAAARTAVW
jgi:hypothetical protein